MKVSWLISPNGLGHAQRATALAAAVVRERPGVEVTFVCERWQVDRLATTPALRALRAAGARFVFELLGDAPRWPIAPGGGDLLAWRPRLAASRLLDDADLVVSDNLAGVLALAPDAVLCGSFLWSDVLAPLAARSPQVARFVADERALLASHRPRMLCNADLAMPGVLAQTRAATLPWMGTPADVELAAGDVVALLGGASGAADAGLIALAQELHRRGVALALSADLARRPDAPPGRPFDHSPEAYQAARLLVCRPGVGTLTRAIAAGRPILTPPEPDHAEMVHNAARVAALGVARALPDGAAADRADAVCTLLADTASLGRLAAAARTRPQGGLAAGAALLLDELDARGAARESA